jgi:hypothetical protein
MRRLVRRLAWGGGALSAVVLALGLTVRLLGPEPPGVSEANVRQIKPGMTIPEVEAILGGRGRFSLLNGNAIYTWEGSGGRADVVCFCRWEFRGGVIHIEDVAVVDACFQMRERADPLARLRALLGW